MNVSFHYCIAFMKYFLTVSLVECLILALHLCEATAMLVSEWMEVYSEHCQQKTQYKQARLTTILEVTIFERGKLEEYDFCVNFTHN